MTVRNEVGGRGPFLQRARELEADDLGISIVTGWPSMAASASMPPTPSRARRGVDHRRVAVRAHECVGYGRFWSRRSGNTTRARNSQFTWWTMPVSGGTTLKLRKAFWPQRRNV